MASSKNKRFVTFVLVFLVAGIGLWGVSEENFFLRDLFAIQAIGGDSGPSPHTVSMVVDLDDPSNVVTGCSASGRVAGYQQCQHECVGHNDRGWCDGIGFYDTDACPREKQHCKRSFNCVSLSPVSVTVGSKTVPVVGGEFSASEIGFEGLKTNFGVTFTANPGGLFSNLRVSCGEGACQPSWSCDAWGGCYITDYLDYPLSRARWCYDSVCGLEKRIEKEACCNTDADCGVCDRECRGNKCVERDLPSEPDNCSVFLPFPDCVWDSDVPVCWECVVDDDCVSCSKVCDDHECVDTYKRVAPEFDCMVWVDYPSCSYDDSGCWSDWFCFDVGEDLIPVNSCEVRSKLPIFVSLREQCYESLGVCEESFWELKDPECRGVRCTLECPFGVVEGSCGCECKPEPPKPPEPPLEECSLENCKKASLRSDCVGGWVVVDEVDCLCGWKCDDVVRQTVAVDVVEDEDRTVWFVIVGILSVGAIFLLL